MGSHLINEEKTWWNDATCLRGVLRNVYFLLFFLAKCRCRLCLEKKEFEKYTQFFFLLFLKCSSISFFSQVECFRETTAPRIGFLSTAGKKAIRDVPLSLHSLPGNNICQPTQLLHRVNLSLGKHHKENISKNGVQ